MKIFKVVGEWREFKRSFPEKTVGFVPTMGALHDAHLSLVKRAKSECDITVVSIYVNPTQFNNVDDLKNYPTPIEEDLEKLRSCGVDFVFLPQYETLYADNYRYKVSENDLSNILCGAHRPGHFDGVLTVVMKLLNIVQPTKAYFGKKDYQQLLLIQDMVKSFFLDVEIVPCEILRESDGLAMSSRNRLLTDEHRKLAPTLNYAIKNGSDLEQISEELTKHGFSVDYIEEHFGRRFVAASLGNVRLIDNVEA